MRRAMFAALALVVAACAHPPSPQEIEAQKMEPVPGKAVVYIAQNRFGNFSARLRFDDGTQITTWPGTFYHWVTTPGTHTIRSNQGNLNASIRLQVEAGQVYFVQHFVTGIRGSTTDARLQQIDDRAGRQLVRANRML